MQIRRPTYPYVGFLLPSAKLYFIFSAKIGRTVENTTSPNFYYFVFIIFVLSNLVSYGCVMDPKPTLNQPIETNKPTFKLKLTLSSNDTGAKANLDPKLTERKGRQRS